MKIRNFFIALKNNPKKSIVFGSLLALGYKFAKSKYEEECLMRKFCEEALQYGQVTQLYSDSERHVTVLLNPAANSHKCKSNYERYCAPLLHLAGIKVAVVRTEHEGQAKEIMSIMDNTNAVVIAGGDGTVQEILTGLLRRDDAYAACQKFPLGILPLGVRNMCASSLWGFSGKPTAHHLAQATMDVVRTITTQLNVLQITPVDDQTSESGVEAKPVYAATNLEWSAFRDAVERKDKYWYWGPLKKYITYVFSTYKDLNWKCDCTLQYSAPCSGCQKCKALEDQRRVEAEQLKKMNARWWHAFIPRKKNEEVVINYSEIVNEECGKLTSVNIENVSDVCISSSNTKSTADVPGYALTVNLGTPDLGSMDFIKEGISRANGNEPTFQQSFLTGELVLETNPSAMNDREGTEREFGIDNSAFEVKPMIIRPLHNAVTVFASRNAFAA